MAAACSGRNVRASSPSSSATAKYACPRQPLRPDTNPAPAPAALDRGILWINLSAPLQERSLRPGDALTLRLAKARTVLTLPAAPKR